MAQTKFRGGRSRKARPYASVIDPKSGSWASALQIRTVREYEARDSIRSGLDFSVGGQSGQPSSRGFCFCSIRVVLQEVAEGLPGSLITSRCRQRLRYEQRDLRSFTVRNCQSVLRRFQGLIILFVMVVGICQGPARFPSGGGIELQRFFQWL